MIYLAHFLHLCIIFGTKDSLCVCLYYSNMKQTKQVELEEMHQIEGAVVVHLRSDHLFFIIYKYWNKFHTILGFKYSTLYILS